MLPWIVVVPLRYLWWWADKHVSFHVSCVSKLHYPSFWKTYCEQHRVGQTSNSCSCFCKSLCCTISVLSVGCSAAMIELEQLTGCHPNPAPCKKGLAALNFSICKISRLVTVDEQNDLDTNKGRKMMAGSFWFHSPRLSFTSTCLWFPWWWLRVWFTGLV